MGTLVRNELMIYKINNKLKFSYYIFEFTKFCFEFKFSKKIDLTQIRDRSPLVQSND